MSTNERGKPTIGMYYNTDNSPPHTPPATDFLSRFSVDPKWGLAEARAQEILLRHGPNCLRAPQMPSRLKILLAQVLNAMTIVLIAATAVSLAVLDWISGGVIVLLVVVNVYVGYSQEWQAANTLAALASVGTPVATVLRHNPDTRETCREGQIRAIAATDVVIGDILLIEIGDIVPADARLLPTYLSNLECDEAVLTGESLPATKTVDPIIDPVCPLGDRTNMVYAGTEVTKGRARCIVVRTGMATELGKISEALNSEKRSNKTGFKRYLEKIRRALGIAGTTPLQITLNKMAYWILFISCILAIIVVSSTGFHDIPDSIAIYAIAAAVSLLPASLIAVVSLTLAAACQDLAKRNALVRRMDAVETLGGVHDICSDKTGTITVGRMVLKKVWTPTNPAPVTQGMRAPCDTVSGQSYAVGSSRDPFYPRGEIRVLNSRGPDTSLEDDPSEVEDMKTEDAHIDNLEPGFQELVQSAALNNMATIKRGEDGMTWEAHGDPTEVAIQVFAHKAGHGKPHLIGTHTENGIARAPIKGHFELILEHPFDSTIKRMSTVWEFLPNNDQESAEDYDLLLYMKGAVEKVLDRCSYIGIGESRRAITHEDRDNLAGHVNALTNEGLRVLCFAGTRLPYSMKDSIPTANRADLEKDCGVLGLVGIYDPPRPESAAAVMDAHRAGIVPRMLTGDHAGTAVFIARSVGILTEQHGDTACMTGQQLDAMTDAEIDALPELPVVVARCSPETKVKMVDALYRRGRKMVMTGDGVNDSPALKRASVGVAMGLNGSDVAKGAADIVLADDNFSTIVQAIRKGRSVFQNLVKFLVYLLSGNVAEVVLILCGLAFRRDGIAVYPIAPPAALYINTLAAGPPALALGVEPTAKDAMNIGPENFQKVFTASWYMDTIGYGVVVGAQAVVNFIIVQYGVANGATDIDPKCNQPLIGLQPGCEVVFKARGTAFATLLVILMVHGLTCKDLTRSLFRMNLLENTSLLWSAGVLALTVLPILYVPELNHRVFQVDGLTWHWGLVFGQLVLYLVLAELYKLARREYIKRKSVLGDKVAPR